MNALDNELEPIWVEVQPLPAGSSVTEALQKLAPGATQVSGLADKVGSITQIAADELQGCLRRVAGAVAMAVEEGGPQSWTVEFAVSFKGTAAIPVVASGEASANLKITLSWKRS